MGLEDLLKPHFEVDLPDANTKLSCRDLPFTTIMLLVSEIAESARQEIIEGKARVLESFTKMAEKPEGGTTNEDVENLFQVMLPVLSRVVMQSDKVTIRVMQDIIIDATEEHIRVLSINDVTAIFTMAVERIDMKLLSEQLKPTFGNALTVVRNLWETTMKKDNEAPTNGQESPPLEQPSQSPV